jgi:pilus assembly protein CpaD
MFRFQQPDRPRTHRRAARIAAIAGIGAALAGCHHTDDVTGSIPFEYRHRHPIAISESNHTTEVFVASKRGGLTAVQRADVLAFSQRWKREAGGGVIIDMPAGGGNERAAVDTLHEIKGVLVAAGVPPHGIQVRPYRPADPRTLATIRINYSKMTAEAGPCGMWPEDLAATLDPVYRDNRPHWNHGCATQRNLASMIDNPADLVQPRGEAPVYAARRAFMLDRYRRGENTATNYPANQGKISDIGK